MEATIIALQERMGWYSLDSDDVGGGEGGVSSSCVRPSSRKSNTRHTSRTYVASEIWCFEPGGLGWLWYSRCAVIRVHQHCNSRKQAALCFYLRREATFRIRPAVSCLTFQERIIW